jgi:chorismate-pyruvate lyase
VAEIYKIMPDKKDAVSRIIIHPTSFGTTCSFSIADKFPAAVEMYLRQDQDIYAITEAILSAITRNEVYRELDGMWSESELLVDWLVTKSSLSPILRKYQPKTVFTPTVKYTRMKQGARLMKESEEFYRRLGVPVLENIFELRDGQPTVAGRPMENISAREKEIFALMIKKQNQIVTVDELADILFKTDEEFSLQAIAKTIQRLRDKLEQNGVSGSFIQTLRGQGYGLKN